MKNRNGYYINKHNIIYVQGTVDGKFYRKSTKKQATKDNITYIKRYSYDVLLKLIDKQLEEQNKISLEEFGFKVLEITSRKRNPITQREKIGQFKKHILPHFKNFALSDIKTSDVEYWQNLLLKKLSTSMVKKCRDTLYLILKKAAADDIIVKNPVEFADGVSVKTRKKEPYTEHELRLLLEHSTGWFHTFLVLVSSTGLRTGEAIGLQWNDIELNHGYIDLKRSISKGKISDENDLTNKTKNHQRLIPLDKATISELSAYYINRPDDTWVFVNKHNTNFSDSRSINQHYWKPLLAKLNISDRTMYALRHTFISIMKNNGANDTWLKSVVGHKQSSRIMDDVYFTFNNQKHKISNTNNFFSFIKKEA